MSASFPPPHVELLGGDAASREAFTALYRARIHPDDQADPRHVLQWLDRPGRLLTQWSAPTPAEARPGTQHALLVARRDDAVIGLATLAFVAEVPVAFIPYVAVAAGCEREVIRALLAALAHGLEALAPAGAWVVFELSAPGGPSARGRLRLFQRYLRELGYGCGVLDVPYRMPSLASGPLGADPGMPAQLVVARRDWTPAPIDGALARTLLTAVVRDVYLDALGASAGPTEPGGGAHPSSPGRAGAALGVPGAEVPAAVAVRG